MKLWAICRFEFGYQIRRAWTWLIVAVLIALSFLVARDGSFAEVLYADFFVNSPFAIAKTTVFGGLVWLLVAAVVAGEAGARDVAAGMHPLTYTLPVSKAEYLGGRLLAALGLNAVILLAVQMGILLAVYAPGVDPELIGPFRPAAHLAAYTFIALPNAFAATALQFLLAARSGRPMASYLASLLLFFTAFFVASLLLFKRGLGTLLDPIGVRFIWEDLPHAWTTIEMSWRMVTLDGAILTNRLVWLGVGLSALALTYQGFRFAHRTESSLLDMLRSLGRRRRQRPAGLAARRTPTVVPQAPRAFGVAMQMRQTLAIARDSFRTVVTSWAGLAMLVAIPLLTVAVVLDQMVSMGTPVIPTTARVLAELTAPLSAELSRWVIVPLLIVFFAGELRWREREAGLGELTDAMPGTEWTPFLGKLLGLGAVLALFMALLTLAGMLAQLIRGYQAFEVGLYLKVLFGLQLPEYFLFAVLALVVHAVIDHKYVGHLVAILAYAFIAALAPMLGIEHNLLVYGAAPGWSYTEMRGFGPFLAPWLWFTFYWAAWATLLAVIARLFWARGKEHGLDVRLRWARRRFTGATASVAGLAVLLIATLGGFIFYNTNVVNDYLGQSGVNDRRAEYERRYGKYENLPQPQLTGTTLRAEIFPDRGAVEIRGSYELVNRTSLPIDTIHVATATSGGETRAITFDRPAAITVDDEQHGYRIYALEKPLAPGDTLRLDFEVRGERRGFGNGGVNPSVTATGTSFTSGNWFPFVGYQRQRALLGPAERRAHGLPPRPVLASLDDEEARGPGRGGGIAFDAVLGTDEGQVAVAPGALRRTWTESGRRYFHYSTDAPIGNEWAFFSANYAVHEGAWSASAGAAPPVAIRIFHHPTHTAHLERMMRTVRASLDYYTTQFGPYPYRHLSLVEHPGAPGMGLHAEASLISYGEGFTYWQPEDESSLDFPSAVVGHEMAHQWTLPYALVEGLPFLSEGLAWYSAIQLVKASRGDAEVGRLLDFMRQPYPYAPIRRGEPLLRALDPYLSYRRGPFAMYAVAEYIGSDRVNGALRRLIERHEAAGAPPATTRDLYRELQAITPDSLKYLLHDLFEVNTFWEFETTRVTAEPTGDGSWTVTLGLKANKVVVDAAGVETAVPLNDWVEVGVFDDTGTHRPIYLQKHHLTAAEQTVTVRVPRQPVRAGIDPRHLLIGWEMDDDNVKTVQN